jgi:peptidoglycan/LPS O-acetylase OafA/YrhL
VHTSFVLMASMERLGLSGSALLRSFYLRRAFRIYPLSIACVLVVVAFRIPELPWGEYAAPTAATLATNLSLTMNLFYGPVVLGPLWSLPVELQMYAVLPFIFLWLHVRRSPLRAAGLLAVALALAAVITPWGRRYAMFEYAPCFMSGVLAWVLSRNAKARLPGWAILPYLAAIVIGYMLLDDWIDGVHPPILAWGVCIVVGLTLPSIAQSRIGPLNRATHSIAKYSYGIYLFHCVALYAGVFALRAPVMVQWSVAAVLLVALSVGSYHWLERPAIALGARLAASGSTARREVAPPT